MTPTELSVGEIVLWIVALNTFLSFGTAVWMLFSGPSRKNTARLDADELRLTAIETSHARLRDSVERMPNAETMHRVELAMARMEGHIDRLDERLKPVAAISERMQELLIEQGRK